MRYAQIRKMDISNGEGVGVALFTQGCPFHCQGCFNPETWDFNGGKLYTQETHNFVLKLLRPQWITRFSILGGEPLIEENLEELAQLILDIREYYPEVNIWLYTGYTFEQLEQYLVNPLTDSEEKIKIILQHIDYLIDGQFKEDEKDITLAFRGSKNQRIIDMGLTLLDRIGTEPVLLKLDK